MSDTCANSIRRHSAAILRQIEEVRAGWAGNECMGNECRIELGMCQDMKAAILGQRSGKSLNDPSLYQGNGGPFEMQLLCDNRLNVKAAVSGQ